MHSSSATHHHGFSWPLSPPIVLTPAETREVSGGGSNVLHGNPGGDTPIGSPGYGPPGGDGGASHSGGFDVHDHE